MMTASNLIEPARFNMPSGWPTSLQLVKDLDRTSCSIKSEESTSTDELDDDQNNDGEGVWSPDIEQSFHEALAIYPPCGRRKIILSDEGKMFGRNELISRYIKMRTGKSRTRKQVSSHIQVLAKRKSKELQSLFKDSNLKEQHRPFVMNQHYHPLRDNTTTSPIITDSNSPYYTHHRTGVSLFSPTTNMNITPTSSSPFKSTANLSPYSSPSTISLWQQPNTPYLDIKPFSPSSTTPIELIPTASTTNSLTTRFISSNRMKLVEFAGYIESKRDIDSRHYLLHISQDAGTDIKPERIKVSQIIDIFPMLKELYDKGPQDAFYVVKVWVNMNYQDTAANIYHCSNYFESSEENLNINITTKVCSYGKTAVEKIESGVTKYNDIIGKCIYRSNDTTMCSYMVEFIKKLKTGIYMREMMNAVLEHLSVLQTVVSKDTDELLLCVAYIFEISESQSLGGTQSVAYRLCD
ncbi:unnamed protein product [Adineta steineri]|uniref:TEA domain-containing protein n=2 Tax=Adineta steineri TaxID=433720 RepID=A0A816A7P3_9BILA|nr:unnamed protein product [Adineta steineri]CAF1339812.1 unnamed protein product [Adineta steineri]CAF1592275.1 unnamed protein product [Adineta steineri]CAF1592456.1 unnamed protein product [Adineta steineri]